MTLNFSFIRIFSTIFLLLNACIASAQTGVLDEAFGDRGKVLTSINNEDVRPSSVALQKDGKIVVSGVAVSGVFVVRYNPSGSVDSGFAKNGIMFGPDEYYFNASMTLQPDEKILLTGIMTPTLLDNFSRFNNDGSLDSMFGKSGKVSGTFEGYSTHGISQMVVKQDGKIVIVGEISADNKNFLGLIQFNEDGSIDSSYGVNGRVIIDNQSSSSGKISMAVSGEKVVVAYAGSSTQTNTKTISTHLLNKDGSIDSGFGNNGTTVTHGLGSEIPNGINIKVDKDGSIIILEDVNEGNVITAGAVTMINADGSEDVSFGDHGTAIIYLSETGININSCNTVSILFDGKIVVTGFATLHAGYDFFLYRLLPNGKTDSSFGRHGNVLTALTDGDNASSSSVVQPDGKIVLVGYTDNPDFRLAVVRYISDPKVYYNTIKGLVYLDVNKNGLPDTSTDKLFPDAIITISKPGVDSISIRTPSGKFETDVDSGTYITSVTPKLPY